MGSVVLAGLHEPGTVVELFEIPSAQTLRAAGGESVDKKLVPADGTVSFLNVNTAGLFIVVGTDIYGNPSEVRTNGLDDSGPVQTPVAPNLNSSVGTGETAQSAPTPATPEAFRTPDAPVPTTDGAATPSSESVEAGATAPVSEPETVAAADIPTVEAPVTVVPPSAEVAAPADTPPAPESSPESPAVAPVAEPSPAPAEQEVPPTT